jgi:hypothetical protein
MAGSCSWEDVTLGATAGVAARAGPPVARPTTATTAARRATLIRLFFDDTSVVLRWGEGIRSGELGGRTAVLARYVLRLRSGSWAATRPPRIGRKAEAPRVAAAYSPPFRK